MAEDWLDRQALWLPDDPWALPASTGCVEGSVMRALDERIAAAKLLVLGEPNHFIREKTDFRLSWLRWLREKSSSRHRQIVIGEELGWADGRRVAAYLSSGESAELAAAATFGGREHERDDRDEAPRGVFADSLADYPHDAMRWAHAGFYAGLRDLGLTAFFGFDVDVPGAGYHAIERAGARAAKAGLGRAFLRELARVPGESLLEEANRLEALVGRFAPLPGFAVVQADLQAMIDSLRYRLLADQAGDYEATRPAMIWREDAMKRRLMSVLEGACSTMEENALIVLLGHAFHLAKDDAGIAGQGVGPGGGGTPSLGHWLNNERQLKTAAVWLLYGAGRDSQPLKDLANESDYPDESVNGLLKAQMQGRGGGLIVPLFTPECPWRAGSGVGHLYNLVAAVDLKAEADALHFVPDVHPLD